MQLIRRPWSRLCMSLCILICGQQARAVEKIEIARQAEIVVVGRLTEIHKRLESNGWRVSGTLIVKELVFGNARSRPRLRYQFLCSCCPRVPSPPIESVAGEGIWFLRSAGPNVWQSAGACSDPGVRRKSDLPEFRKFLRTRSIEAK